MLREPCCSHMTAKRRLTYCGEIQRVPHNIAARSEARSQPYLVLYLMESTKCRSKETISEKVQCIGCVVGAKRPILQQGWLVRQVIIPTAEEGMSRSRQEQEQRRSFPSRWETEATIVPLGH